MLADIGGNLKIQRLQDTAIFDSKSMNVGGRVTLGDRAGASGSFSQSKVNADYTAVALAAATAISEATKSVDEIKQLAQAVQSADQNTVIRLGLTVGRSQSSSAQTNKAGQAAETRPVRAIVATYSGR